MTGEHGSLYHCVVCDTVVEAVEDNSLELSCCGRAMEIMQPQSSSAGWHRHRPVFDLKGHRLTVSIGALSHPSDDSHHIVWIELICGDVATRKYIGPAKLAQATFEIDHHDYVVRAMCNQHGLWQTASVYRQGKYVEVHEDPLLRFSSYQPAHHRRR